MNHAERERLFLEIFHQNKSRVQRLCFAYLNSTADIDDLFQEIMTNLWNALPTFRGDSRTDRNQYAASGALAHLLHASTGIRDASFSQSGRRPTRKVWSNLSF